jgi:hypothetical protein
MEMRVKGVKYYRNRHGKWYAYHRKTGRRIGAEPGTAAFLAELEEIERGAGSEPPPLAGTLGALIADYRESPEFTQLAPRTRSDYRAIFDYLKPLAAHPLSGINAAYAIRVRDHAFKRKKRHFANYVVVVMRLLFKWGKVRGRLRDNPAADVPKLLRPKGMPKANRRWTAEELRIVLDAMPPELRLATALGVTTGMREGDVLRFPWSGYRDGLIQGRAA